MTSQARLSDTVTTGIVFFVVALFGSQFVHLAAKLLADDVPVTQIGFARFAVQVLVLLPVVIASSGANFLRPPGLRIHILRGLLLSCATLCYFSALGVMPLADASAIFFIEPFVLTLISVPLLGETLGWRRLLAIAVGFSGALLVIRPGFSELGLSTLLPAIAAVLFALYIALTRKHARTTPATVLQFHAGLYGTLVFAVVIAIGVLTGDADFQPVLPDTRQLGLLLVVGGFATFGNLLVTQALVRAPASTLAPLQYLEIVGAITVGYIAFGDFPDLPTWAGVTIIVASGLFVVFRERRLSRGPSTEIAATSTSTAGIAPEAGTSEPER